MPTIDLNALALRLASRQPGRTEATVQSDIHALLLAAPLNLDDSQLEDIVLESPAGSRRRIDIEVGTTVIEVKRDLRAGNVLAEAIVQLAGYVERRTRDLRQRYVGILTDGADWRLYHLHDDALHEFSRFELSTRQPDVEALWVWLEGVLATATALTPTPREIVRRLGADSPAHALDAGHLAALYDAHRDLPTVKLKRELWARLLTTALGTNFRDDDELFVNHTLLVTTAEVVAHAVVGLDPADSTITPATLVSGELFRRAQIGGVVEPDFFDWVVEVPGGDLFVRTLARRLARFVWEDVEHDVMKVLYESVIQAEQRHRLGEYYTPDWLADRVVAETVTDPLNQRVVDPGCGSGTFVFHAVRRYLDAADAAGHSNAEAIAGVTARVAGMDVHPVAVTLARVTYALAIGMTRMRAPDRPPLNVPVYLGDSLQWGQARTLFSAEALTVATSDGTERQLRIPGGGIADDLRFPDRVLADAGQFDRLVGELAEKASERSAGAASPSLTSLFRRYAIHPDDQPIIEQTFSLMCRLHDEGRDHIWGYYVRNLARPAWLARRANRVDVLLGNPPWVAYRFMTAGQQEEFSEMSRERNLWHGATVATHQDLSALFVVRCVELYLRDGGRFGFVMPRAVLDRRQFVGFRSGRYTSDAGGVHIGVAFTKAWDLHQVRPPLFPVPASVVFGTRSTEEAVPLPVSDRVLWSGRLPTPNLTWEQASSELVRTRNTAVITEDGRSPYHARFSQGATVVPRMLFMVEDVTDRQPLGVGAGRRAVRSARSPNEKRPWRDLQSREGHVEVQFIRPLLLGSSLLPFRLHVPDLAVIPWDGQRVLSETDPRLDLYPGLAEWWRDGEAIWRTNRSSERLSLTDQLDYRNKLSQQVPPSPHRVVYGKGGMYLAAARVEDVNAVIDHKLYWASVSGPTEGRYLVAMLNSDVLTERVRPLQGRGEHNPRDYDKYVWRVPIPLYNAEDERHQRLATIGERAEQYVSALELPSVRFEAQRRFLREALLREGIAAELNEAVTAVLP